MTTLLYHAGALGDFITIIPALHFWKSRNPGSRLTLLGRPHIGELARAGGIIDDFLAVDSARLLPLFTDHDSPAAEKLLDLFTSAIIFSHPDLPLLQHCRNRPGLQLSWQPPFPSARQHVVDYHLSLFTDPSTVPEREKMPCLSVQAEPPGDLIKSDNPPIALHYGSGSTLKNWPIERFLALADLLRNKGCKIVWMGGPAEEELPLPHGDRLIRDAPLPSCAALLARCRAYVGNDSGITHLTAAVGCPTVAIFGPSEPAIWAPRGERVRIVSANHPCAPCHRTSPVHETCDNGCLLRITVKEVYASILSLL
jgi:heptosyltransferase III